MEKYVLFSPVSGSDPAQADRADGVFRDGPMLHIVRHYRPHTVCLYMTKPFARHENGDGDRRFTRAIGHIAPDCRIQLQYCAAGDEVAHFDYFDKPFADLLNTLHEENPDSTLLLNLSSGTPQMQASLYLAAATAAFPVVSVQVSTPARGPNRAPAAFSVEAMLSRLGEDGNLGPQYTEDRCRRVSCQNARRTILKENINSLVKHYDYSAAKLICHSKDAKALFSPKTELLLRAATDHLTLNREDVPKLNSKLGKSPDGEELLRFLWQDFYEQPSIIRTETERDCYDYLLYMGTLISRAAYSDFARALSPALTTIMRLRLSGAGHDILQFCEEDKCGVTKLRSNKIRGLDKAFLDFLDEKYSGYSNGFQDRPLSAQYMLDYMKYLNGQNIDLGYNNFDRLRNAESSIRNLAAHEMRGISAQEIQQAISGTPKDILNLLQEEYQNALGITGLQWDGLERLNRRIYAETDKMPG